MLPVTLQESKSSGDFQRGVLIVFEGLDRSGKTTLSAKLADTLNNSNKKTTLNRFPDRSTETGQVIDKFLTKKVDLNAETIHLLYSANRWEKKELIEETLNSGVNVILDRYCYSGVAYSMAKGVDEEWCKNSDKGLPAPDLLFFLDVSQEEAQKRSGFGDERYEVTDFLIKVKSAYDKLRDDSWIIVDVNNRSIDDICFTLCSHVNMKITEFQSRTIPINRLW